MRLLLILIATTILVLPVQARAAALDTLASGGAGGWLNVTRPLNADDMKGRVILLDFWTYGCINCMQVVPDLSYLEEKFGDRLLIIGVHSAKFKGEQGNDRILAAAKRFGLKHPVINDSDFAIWNSFHVNAWPTFVVLDPQGGEVARFSGEGHRADLEAAIAGAAPAAAASLSGVVADDASTGILSFPARLAYAPQTIWGPVVFIADSGHNRILAVDQGGAVKTTIGSGKTGLKDAGFADAAFNHPRGITYADGYLYVADTGNHALRRVDLAAQTVKTLAGDGQKGQVASPWDVEMMEDGHTLAVAMAGRHQLWTYDTATEKLGVLAGTRAENIDDGPALQATLAQPSGLSLAGQSLFFADAESSALRVLENGRVKTLIGTGLFDFGKVDGSYPQAMMQHPQGLYADSKRILIADTYNNAIRSYDRKTGILSTLPLSGVALNEPGDILPVGSDFWIADTNNHLIKKINPETGIVSDIALTPAAP